MFFSSKKEYPANHEVKDDLGHHGDWCMISEEKGKAHLDEALKVLSKAHKSDEHRQSEMGKPHGDFSHNILGIGQTGWHMSFSPHDDQGGRYVPQSRIITKPKDWADETLLVPHEGLTWLLKEYRQAIGKLDRPDTPAWKCKNIQLFVQNFLLPMVVHHHHCEENIFFPFLRHRVKLPESMTTEHHDLVVLLGEMAKIDYAQMSPQDYAKKSIAITDKLFKLWTQHVENEETYIPGYLRENFTCTEGAVVEKIIGATLGPHGMAMMVPLIVYGMRNIWGGDKKANEFVHGNMPLPMRALYIHSWRPAFFKYVIGLLKSVDEPKDNFKAGVIGYPYGPKSTWWRVPMPNLRHHLDGAHETGKGGFGLHGKFLKRTNSA